MAIAIRLLRPGYSLVLLDWVIGPQFSLRREIWGLDGGLVAAMPAAVFFHAVQWALGPAAASWIPLLLMFPLAGWALGRLVAVPLYATAPATLLFLVNPWVYDRVLVGHLGLLLGFALLPMLVRSILLSRQASGAQRLRPALWMAILVGLSPHYLWIGGVLLAAATVAVGERARWLRELGWLTATAGTVAATSAYLAASGAHGGQASLDALAAFSTRGTTWWQVYGNLLRLEGFWRRGPTLASDLIAGWPFFVAAVLLLAFLGAFWFWRDPVAGPVVRTAAVAGVAGLVLAAGNRGPGGAVFRWAYETVPGFGIMREPQKFAALVVLCYAVLAAYGVSGLAGRISTRKLVVASVTAIPLAWSPMLVFGTGTDLLPSRLSSSWTRVNEHTGNGPGRVLVLPWHQYLAFRATGNRTITNPAPVLLQRVPISGDNLEAGQLRSTSASLVSPYLEFLFSRGREITAFGHLIRPLGVEYVLLLKEVDWRAYAWLGSQSDLVVVAEFDDMILYRLADAAPVGERTEDVVSARDWGEAVALANRGNRARIIVAEARAPGPVEVAQTPRGQEQGKMRSRSARLRRTGTISYEAPAGPGLIAVPEAFDEGWTFRGERPRASAAGTVLFEGAEAGAIRYDCFERIVKYAISGVSLLVLLVLRARSGDVARRGRSTTRRAKPG